MPYSLSQTLIQEFFLIQPGEDTLPAYVHIRPIDVSVEEGRRELLQSDIWVKSELDEFRRSLELTIEDVHLREVYLTLAECNLCESDGSFLFNFKDQRLDMTEDEFFLAWGRISLSYKQQIIELVHLVNPVWVLREVEYG